MSLEMHRLLSEYRPAKSLARMEFNDELVRYLVEQARLAPSANNVQPWRFRCWRDPETIGAVAKAAGFKDLENAGALLTINAEEGFFKNRWKQQPFMLVDVPIACLHVLLAAHDKGIGSRVLYNFSKQDVQNVLRMEKKPPLVALVFLGEALETEDPLDLAGFAPVTNDGYGA